MDEFTRALGNSQPVLLALNLVLSFLVVIFFVFIEKVVNIWLVFLVNIQFSLVLNYCVALAIEVLKNFTEGLGFL